MDHIRTRNKNNIILYTNPFEDYNLLKNEINKSITSTLDSGKYILGDNLNKFQIEFASYIGTKYSVGVASGTDAIFMSLKVLNIGRGDEVITVSHTATATVSAIVATGATPILVDINKDDFCMNLEHLDKSITKKTKAIIPVHLYGQMVNMKKLIKISKKYKIDIIEDSSQSHGASYDNKKSGSFGKLSCFSFYPTKNLGCYGDGGAITTNSKSLYNKLLMMREYGWKPKFNSISYGLNSRLDEIHASVLRIKLKKLDNFNYKRIKLADKYFNEIKNKKIILPKINNLNKHVFHLFVIRTNKRDMLKKYLEKNKIITGIQYPIPIHKQKYFSKIVKFNKLTNTEIISNEILSLPIYPSLKIKYINKVIQILNKF